MTVAPAAATVVFVAVATVPSCCCLFCAAIWQPLVSSLVALTISAPPLVTLPCSGVSFPPLAMVFLPLAAFFLSLWQTLLLSSSSGLLIWQSLSSFSDNFCLLELVPYSLWLLLFHCLSRSGCLSFCIWQSLQLSSTQSAVSTPRLAVLCLLWQSLLVSSSVSLSPGLAVSPHLAVSASGHPLAALFLHLASLFCPSPLFLSLPLSASISDRVSSLHQSRQVCQSASPLS